MTNDLKSDMSARERQAFDLGYELGRSHARRLEASKRKGPVIPVVVNPFTPRATKFPESLEAADWAGVVREIKR